MNCHYVPQFYLKNFSIPDEMGYIYAHRRNKEPLKTTPKSVAAKNDLYILKDKKGRKNDEAEKMFAHLEGQCEPIIKKIINSDKLELSEGDKILLSHFISFLHIRNLSYLAKQKNSYITIMKKMMELNATNKEVFKNVLKESKAKVDINNEREVKKLRKSVLNFDEHFKIGFSKGSDDYFIATALEHGLLLVPYVYTKKWCLLVSDCSRVFITSDNPVVLIRPKGLPPFYGCGFANSHIYMPISEKKSLLLAVEKEHPENIKIKRELVDYFNRHIMFSAHKFIYSNILSRDFSKNFNKTKEGESEKVIMS